MAYWKERRELNTLIKRVEKKVTNLKYYEEQYKSMASKIKTVPLIDIRFSADEMSIDVKNTLKKYSKDNDRDIRYTTKIMRDILKTADKYSEDIEALNTSGSFRTDLLGETLFNTFMSERFKGMSDSANKNTYGDTGENLAIDTVIDALDNVKGINKRRLINYLNDRYEKQGLNRIFDKTTILNALRN